MKKLTNYLGVALLMVAALAVPVFAAVQANDTIIVKEGQVINDDWFGAGSEIIIEGTINGDVYAASNRLVIRGEVNGDVIAAANNIEVTGTIRDDLRAVGESISLIGANIGDSASVAGNTFSVDGDSVISGGIVFGGRSLIVDGPVGRGVMAGGDVVRIDSNIGRDVRVAATTVTIGSNAVIDGDVEYKSDKTATVTGEVRGDVIRGEGSVPEINTQGALRALAAGFTVWAFLAATIVGGVLLWLFPKLFTRGDQVLWKQPSRVIGYGALALLATLPAVVVLMITVIGVPLALIILTVWLIALYTAKLLVGFSIGQWLLSKINSKDDYQPNRFSALVLGLALFYLVRLLPGVGWLIAMIVSAAGLGMMLSFRVKVEAKQKS